VRTPAFWAGPPGLVARLLQPLGWLYGRVTAHRMARPGTSAAVPVICIGNPTAGGSGKTPLVLALLVRAIERGETPFALTRGHGGRLAGPVLIDPARHGATETGDEPQLLARVAPTVVARDRAAGARLAAAAGATLVVMDDGLQNPSLAKDAVAAVIDGGAGLGNGLCLPAGPLRAPITRQWPLMHHVLVVGAGRPGEDAAGEATAAGVPVWQGHLVPDAAAVAALAGRPLLAFAGIGRPQKFFETLRDAGLDVRRAVAFADHHRFIPAEIADLLREADMHGLVPVTTEKDSVRLPESARATIRTLPVTLQGCEPLLDALIDRAKAAVLSRSAGSPAA
jgi:tetraacyldisaccharide 4'-kinase